MFKCKLGKLFICIKICHEFMFVKYYTIKIIIPIELILDFFYIFKIITFYTVYIFVCKKSCLNIHNYCTVSKCYRYKDCSTIYLYMFKIQSIKKKTKIFTLFMVNIALYRFIMRR